jgi:hypothetical protein
LLLLSVFGGGGPMIRASGGRLKDVGRMGCGKVAVAGPEK